MRWLTLLAVAACAAQAHVVPPQPTALARIEAAPDLSGAPLGHTGAHATIVVVLASWCEHCKAELAELDELRAQHPQLRIVAVNYRAHEEYDHRGSPAAIRAYASAHPWLRIAPIDDDLWRVLGAPPMVPTLFVFDAHGALVDEFDRRQRDMPRARQLAGVLARLGA